jgi:hypothetical protein
VAAHQRALITSCEASGCLQVGQRSSAALSMSTREGEAEFMLSPYRPISRPDGDRLGPPIRCQRKYPSVVSPYARSDPTRAERTSWCPGYAILEGGVPLRQAGTFGAGPSGDGARLHWPQPRLWRPRRHRIDFPYEHRVDPEVPIEDVAGGPCATSSLAAGRPCGARLAGLS